MALAAEPRGLHVGKRAKLEVLRMQTWQEALLSKVSSAQLCQVPGSKGQAVAGKAGQGPATSHASSPGMLSPELAASSCSACCQGCWDSQLPPTLPHPKHKVPVAWP